jgi:hypothetical protein
MDCLQAGEIELSRERIVDQLRDTLVSPACLEAFQLFRYGDLCRRGPETAFEEVWPDHYRDVGLCPGICRPNPIQD